MIMALEDFFTRGNANGGIEQRKMRSRAVSDSLGFCTSAPSIDRISVRS